MPGRLSEWAYDVGVHDWDFSKATKQRIRLSTLGTRRWRLAQTLFRRACRSTTFVQAIRETGCPRHWNAVQLRERRMLSITPAVAAHVLSFLTESLDRVVRQITHCESRSGSLRSMARAGKGRGYQVPERVRRSLW